MGEENTEKRFQKWCRFYRANIDDVQKYGKNIRQMTRIFGRLPTVKKYKILTSNEHLNITLKLEALNNRILFDTFRQCFC